MVDQNDIRIVGHLREEVDAEQLALAIVEFLPLLHRASREQIEVIGEEIRRRLDDAAKGRTEPAA